ncbi:MAG: serine hydrolase [Patescibacteria group bacterium]|jgi:D-alanyl-D-alanine carboxypeptidase
MWPALAISLFIFTQILPSSFLDRPPQVGFDARGQGQITAVVQPTAIVYQAVPPVKTGNSLGIKTTASSAIVYEPASQTVLFAKNVDALRPIASLSKLMTALVFLEHNPGLEKEVEITADDIVPGGSDHLKADDRVTVENLFYTCLIGSDNVAASALARSTGLATIDFVAQMNDRASRMGFTQTHFEEVTGLNQANVSTAAEVARLLDYALNNSLIRQAVLLPEYTFMPIDTNKTRRVTNTDLLIDSFIQVDGGKTGYTNEAGYCFAARASDGNGHRIIAVVLGAANDSARFQEVKGLIAWTFSNWLWNK